MPRSVCIRGHRVPALAEVRLDPVFIGAELQDACAFLTDENTPPGTAIVNAAELLQA